jgi:hypothetical protein
MKVTRSEAQRGEITTRPGRPMEKGLGIYAT